MKFFFIAPIFEIMRIVVSITSFQLCNMGPKLQKLEIFETE